MADTRSFLFRTEPMQANRHFYHVLTGEEVIENGDEWVSITKDNPDQHPYFLGKKPEAMPMQSALHILKDLRLLTQKWRTPACIYGGAIRRSLQEKFQIGNDLDLLIFTEDFSQVNIEKKLAEIKKIYPGINIKEFNPSKDRPNSRYFKFNYQGLIFDVTFCGDQETVLQTKKGYTTLTRQHSVMRNIDGKIYNNFAIIDVLDTDKQDLIDNLPFPCDLENLTALQFYLMFKKKENISPLLELILNNQLIRGLVQILYAHEWLSHVGNQLRREGGEALNMLYQGGILNLLFPSIDKLLIEKPKVFEFLKKILNDFKEKIQIDALQKKSTLPSQNEDQDIRELAIFELLKNIIIADTYERMIEENLTVGASKILENIETNLMEQISTLANFNSIDLTKYKFDSLSLKKEMYQYISFRRNVKEVEPLPPSPRALLAALFTPKSQQTPSGYLSVLHFPFESIIETLEALFPENRKYLLGSHIVPVSPLNDVDLQTLFDNLSVLEDKEEILDLKTRLSNQFSKKPIAYKRKTALIIPTPAIESITVSSTVKKNRKQRRKAKEASELLALKDQDKERQARTDQLNQEIALLLQDEHAPGAKKSPPMLIKRVIPEKYTQNFQTFPLAQTSITYWDENVCSENFINSNSVDAIYNAILKDATKIESCPPNYALPVLIRLLRANERGRLNEKIEMLLASISGIPDKFIMQEFMKISDRSEFLIGYIEHQIEMINNEYETFDTERKFELLSVLKHLKEALFYHELSKPSPNPYTLLFLAIQVGKLDLLNVLREKNLFFDDMLDFRDAIYNSSLHLAAKNNAQDFVRYILENVGSTNLNTLNENHEYTYSICIRNHFNDCLAMLLSAPSANPNLVMDGNPLLHLAVLNDNLEAFRLLLNAKANPNILSSNGQNLYDVVLTLAPDRKELFLQELERHAVSYDKNSEVKDELKNTELMLLLYRDDIDEKDKLRLINDSEIYQTLHFKNIEENQALHIALLTKQFLIAEKLVRMGASLSAVNYETLSPLRILINKFNQLLETLNDSSLDQLSILINFCFNQDINPTEAKNILIEAIQSGNIALLKLIPTHFYSLPFNDHSYLIHFAVENKRTEVVQYLLSANSKLIQLQDTEGNTPVHLAVKDNSDIMIKTILLAMNNKLTVPINYQHETPFQYRERFVRDQSQTESELKKEKLIKFLLENALKPEVITVGENKVNIINYPPMDLADTEQYEAEVNKIIASFAKRTPIESYKQQLVTDPKLALSLLIKMIKLHAKSKYYRNIIGYIINTLGLIFDVNYLKEVDYASLPRDAILNSNIYTELKNFLKTHAPSNKKERDEYEKLLSIYKRVSHTVFKVLSSLSDAPIEKQIDFFGTAVVIGQMYLINQFIDKNIVTKKYFTSFYNGGRENILTFAVKYNSKDILPWLLKNSDCVNHLNDDHERATELAIKLHHNDCLKILATSADLNLANKEGLSLFHLAIKNGNLNALEILLNHHANPYIYTPQGENLYDTCNLIDDANLKIKMISELKRLGIEDRKLKEDLLKDTNDFDDTPLMNFLGQLGADTFSSDLRDIFSIKDIQNTLQVNINGLNAIQLALSNEQYSIALQLLKLGACLPLSEGHPFLTSNINIEAIDEDDLPGLRELLEYGLEQNIINLDFLITLENITDDGDVIALNFYIDFLKERFNTYVDGHQNTFLHRAIQNFNKETFDVLLVKCPDLQKIPNANNLLPLHMAINVDSEGYFVREILKAYPYLAASDEMPTPPLDMAFNLGNITACKVLLDFVPLKDLSSFFDTASSIPNVHPKKQEIIELARNRISALSEPSEESRNKLKR